MKERYHISGMTCSACSSHVEKAVNKLSGVEKASVNLLTETMEVSYDQKDLTGEEIVAFSTPDSLFTAFSTWEEQAEQVMPDI